MRKHPHNLIFNFSLALVPIADPLLGPVMDSLWGPVTFVYEMTSIYYIYPRMK